MVTLVCPNCASSTTVATTEGVSACPHCGRPLTVTGDTCAQETKVHVAETELAPAEPEPDDQALIAELQEAFGFRGGALGPAGRGPPVNGGPSSEAFSRVLDAATLPAGSRLGDFEILGQLGRGGMGVVYRARQVSLNREVALKVLPGYARHGHLAVQRFRAEAQAAARLHHTNIVAVYAQGEQNGHFYYAMELIDGVGLDVVIRSRPDLLSSTRARSSSAAARIISRPADGAASPSGTRRVEGEAGMSPQPLDNRSTVAPVEKRCAARAGRWTRADYPHLAALVAEVADALECAHQHGIIHRDVKPHNLLLGATNRLHLTDFGLARLTSEPHLTASGEIMGTPAYLSPEQVRAEVGKIDHRTDIYSLGITLYELLTRRKPFDGETREQIITGICTTEPIAPRRLDRHIPIDLETICLRAMEKAPQRRYPTAALLAEDLRRLAEGRPILSRRTTRIEKAAKWVRRHKALSAAVTATAAVIVLATGLTWSVSAGRHREAQQLLDGAYEQLAYFDYRAPEVVEADLARAEALGADPWALHRVRALASLGSNEKTAAISHLEAVLQRDPTDLRAWYLLAWAQRREPNGDRAAASATLAQAEARGPPTTADAWFFRGLALHFDEPEAAIDSYRRANALRAAQHAFYPQAVLHLARARNQQLYSTRSLEPFPEAEESLRQLVQQKQYGAYPYYLLSIAHRLAAEIYQGSTGTRGDALVAEHYARALEWARRGQEVAPTDDRPITAEAECLEGTGHFAEAITVRSRAIAVADADAKRCEGYHYRWRLHYWMGELDAALADVTAHAACDPDSHFYAHVYPALIHAERGDMPAALAQARALADEPPGSAQAIIWSATCLRLLGQTEEAQSLLTERAAAVDFAAELVPPQTEQWVRALYAYCCHGGPLTTLEALAEEAASPWKLWGEAWFHAAALRLAAGDRAGAVEGLLRAYRSFDGEERYTYHAKLIYSKMRADSVWPPWVATVSWDGVRDARPASDAE